MKRLVISSVSVIMAANIAAAAGYANKALPAKKNTVVRFDEATNSVIEIPEQPPTVQIQPQQIYAAQPTQQQLYAPQPVYFVNQQQPSVQDQPLTVVEASPLKESRAEQLRKARQNAETQTEMKIVEKLEEARMEDERARSERLFGQGFGSNLQNQQPLTQPVAPLSAPVVVAPVPQPIAPVQPIVEASPIVEDHHEKVDVREEIRAAFAEHNAEKKVDSKVYVSAMVGAADYPDVKNVRGNVATGFAVGIITPERIVGEGSFMYSDYRIQVLDGFQSPYPLFKDLQQYNIAAAMKYLIFPGRFSPFLGAIASYTNRTYSDRQGPQINSTETSTQAFDVGLTAGAELGLTNTFSMGVDFRYYTNVSYRQDSDFQRSFIGPRIGRPIEELDYYTATLSGRFSF